MSFLRGTLPPPLSNRTYPPPPLSNRTIDLGITSVSGNWVQSKPRVNSLFCVVSGKARPESNRQRTRALHTLPSVGYRHKEGELGDWRSSERVVNTTYLVAFSFSTVMATANVFRLPRHIGVTHFPQRRIPLFWVIAPGSPLTCDLPCGQRYSNRFPFPQAGFNKRLNSVLIARWAGGPHIKSRLYTTGCPIHSCSE